MLRKFLIALAAIVVVLVFVVATRPSTFHVERATTIAAPPEAVFAQVNDFHAWGAWSPWEKLDTQMKKTFDGPASGVGSGYAWVGNKDVGEGRMTITKSDKPSLVGIKLEFIKPFASTSQTTFTFKAEAAGTNVTWAMDGENNFVAKAMCMFMDMDKMIGGDFERGLAAMKTAAENAKGQAASAGEAEKGK